MAARRAQSDNGGLWKALALILVSVVITGTTAYLTLSKGTPTMEQMREERGKSERENEIAAKAMLALAAEVSELRRNLQDVRFEEGKRGVRLERIDQQLSMLETRLLAMDVLQGDFRGLRLEFTHVKEGQQKLEALISRVDGLVREINERLQRRTEPPVESPRKNLPRGFP